MSELHPDVNSQMNQMFEEYDETLATNEASVEQLAIDEVADYTDSISSAVVKRDYLPGESAEHDTLKAQYDAAQQLNNDFYDIHEIITSPEEDKSDAEEMLKAWFQRLEQFRELTAREREFLERGVEFLEEEALKNQTCIDEWFIAHWLLNDADPHEIVQQAGESYHEFIGDDDMTRELDNYFTRGEIRRNVEEANETGDAGSRYTAACVLWAFAHEQQRIQRPDIVIAALSRITGNSYEEDWSGFAESIKAGVVDDLLDKETASQIIELVADFGRSGHYPNDISSHELGIAVGTLAKLGDLELTTTS